MPSKIEVVLALSDKVIIAAIVIIAILGALFFTGIISIYATILIAAIITIAFFIVVYKIVKAQFAKPKVGGEALIGKRGKVTSALEPEGMIIVEGEYWKAESTEPLNEGAEVEIIEYQGLKLKVKRVG